MVKLFVQGSYVITAELLDAAGALEEGDEPSNILCESTVRRKNQSHGK